MFTRPGARFPAIRVGRTVRITRPSPGNPLDGGSVRGRRAREAAVNLNRSAVGGANPYYQQ